jgi:hypothetical protein
MHNQASFLGRTAEEMLFVRERHHDIDNCIDLVGLIGK